MERKAIEEPLSYSAQNVERKAIEEPLSYSAQNVERKAIEEPLSYSAQRRYSILEGNYRWFCEHTTKI